MQSILSYENVNLVQKRETVLFIQKSITSKGPSLHERRMSNSSAPGTGNNESTAVQLVWEVSIRFLFSYLTLELFVRFISSKPGS